MQNLDGPHVRELEGRGVVREHGAVRERLVLHRDEDLLAEHAGIAQVVVEQRRHKPEMKRDGLIVAGEELEVPAHGGRRRRFGGQPNAQQRRVAREDDVVGGFWHCCYPFIDQEAERPVCFSRGIAGA